MKKILIIFFLCLAWCGSLWAQGNVFHEADFNNSSYEDLSDFMRRFPGLYPLDYGTLGAPMIFRPWNLNPWQMQVEKDGILQNRISDGLYDSNLQPVLELDSMRYDFLSGGAGGKIYLTTRSIPVDTPLTELHIREGFYGYGTVDFAHGQRVYRSLTMEITGRLAWHDSLRSRTSTRTNRLRGRLGVDLGSGWRSELVYAGSNVNSEFPIATANPYSEREEAILSVHQKDSARTVFNPSVSLFHRQDRENWGNLFRLRETVDGWNFACHAELPWQRLSFRQQTQLSSLSFPTQKSIHAMMNRIEAEDSLRLSFGGMVFNGALHQTSAIRGKINPLVDVSWKFQTRPFRSLSPYTGMQYLENTPGLLWTKSRYALIDRPVNYGPEFVDLTTTYDSERLYNANQGVDRYMKTTLGLLWRKERAFIDFQVMTIWPTGSFHNRFVIKDSAITLEYFNSGAPKPHPGLSATAVVPLKYGLRIDSWWFTEMESSTGSDRTFDNTKGYMRLYFERDFFKSPLTIRSHLSYEFIGARDAFSDRGSVRLGYAHLVGFRLSATIRGVSLVWGTENLLKTQYDIVPGYKMIGKEEYLAFVWKLWL